MKILLVTSSYAPVAGGLQIVTLQLARELNRRGHEVSVVTNRYPRMLPRREMLERVPVVRWLFIQPRLRYLRTLRLDLFMAGLLWFPLTLTRLVIFLASTNQEVVNLYFVGEPALFVLLAHWLVSFRLVVSLHGDDVEGSPRSSSFNRWLFKSILARADAVTACSRYLLAQAAEIAPSAREKGHVIYNGIDLRSPRPASRNECALLAVGRMVPKKGFDILLRALAQGEGEWKLTLLGDGPESAKLRQLSSELGLTGRVIFHGNQIRTDVLEAMANANVVVVPSRLESFGMVALEAMSMGKPVVATTVGGLAEVLSGADAVLVEPEDPVALAKGIDQAFGQLKSDSCFGMRNRELAKRFSLTKMVDNYLAVY